MIYLLKKRHLNAIKENNIRMMPMNSFEDVRLPLNSEVLNLIEAIEEGYPIPPIDVFKKDGKYIVKDGRHRYLAHLLLDKKSIMCHVRYER